MSTTKATAEHQIVTVKVFLACVLAAEIRHSGRAIAQSCRRAVEAHKVKALSLWPGGNAFD